MPIIVQCPFFKKENGLKTYCEGGTIRHPDARARREYMMTFCASEYGWHNCSLAKSLDNYYERKEEY